MTSATTTERLIAPHGGTLVDRTGESPADLDSLEVVAITSRELSDLDMIASGALSPLEGFMGREDYERVVEEMHLMNGLPWALPVCLDVDSAPVGDRVALTDEGGTPVAVSPNSSHPVVGSGPSGISPSSGWVKVPEAYFGCLAMRARHADQEPNCISSRTGW